MSQPETSVEKVHPYIKPERTFWRDQHLSQRHRMYGISLPCTDIDLLMVELDRAQAVALIEYKHERSPPQFATQATYLALSRLGQAAGVPAFAVRYAQDFTWWKVTPLNAVAKDLYPDRQEMTEYQYIHFLYHLRGLKPPQEVFKYLEVAI